MSIIQSLYLEFTHAYERPLSILGSRGAYRKDVSIIHSSPPEIYADASLVDFKVFRDACLEVWGFVLYLHTKNIFELIEFF